MIRKFLILTTLITIPVIGGSTTAKAEEYCREYTKTVSVGGQRENAYGTACYRPDGSWEIVSTSGSDYGRAQVRDVILRDVGRVYDPRPYYNVNVIERPYYRPTYHTYHHRLYHRPYAARHAYTHYDGKHKKHKHKHGKRHYKHYGHR